MRQHLYGSIFDVALQYFNHTFITFQAEKSIYMGVKGVVFDVSSGASKYKKYIKLYEVIGQNLLIHFLKCLLYVIFVQNWIFRTTSIRRSNRK